MYPETEPRRGGFGGTVFAVVAIALIALPEPSRRCRASMGSSACSGSRRRRPACRSELAALQAERATIANKTRRLSSRHLDPDLLDEQARKVLGLGRPDEIIIR